MKTLSGLLLKPLLIALVLPGMFSLHAQEADHGAAPAEVVERLETVLIDNMKAGNTQTFDQRFDKLRPLVAEIMAVDRMGRYLFGSDWAALDQHQRDGFKDAFLDLSAATYAGQFKEFGGERFDPVEVQRQGDDRAVVKRRLTTGSGRKIAFDYLMTHSEDGWQIVTIITDGVSDLAVKRSQYRRLLANENFDAVVSRIRESVESQRSG